MTGSMKGPVAIARASWGTAMPDWVSLLAEKCEASSQNRVARELGRSASLVSAVLRAKYLGDYAAVADVVRGVYACATVDCPQLGTIPANACQDWRLKARSFASVNSLRVDMYRACHRCPRHLKTEPVDVDQ